MTRFFFDTAVFVYALGAEHPYRAPCRRLVDLAADGRLRGEASVELVQELVHVRARRTGRRREAVQEAEDVIALCWLHEMTTADLHLALSLFRDLDGLHMRDAIHAATALNRGVERILSPDRAFDTVAGLVRIDPTEAEAVLLNP